MIAYRWIYSVAFASIALFALLFRNPFLGIVGSGYLVAMIGLWRWGKWGRRASVLPPLAVVIYTGPNVAYNFWLFFTDAPLYQDSPATIFVVAFECVVLTVPAVLVVLVYCFNWRSLIGRLPPA